MLRAAGYACHGIIMSASVSKQTQKQCVPVTADSVDSGALFTRFKMRPPALTRTLEYILQCQCHYLDDAAIVLVAIAETFIGTPVTP